MGIVFEAETEMAEVVGVVTRLRHRAQEHLAHEFLMRFVLHFEKKTLDLFRFCDGQAFELMTETHDHFCEIGEFLFGRFFMDAVDRRALRGEIARDVFIREQHEFLDELVGILAFLQPDIRRFALIVELYLLLLEVEVDTAVLDAVGVKYLEEFAHFGERRFEFFVVERFLALEKPFHFVVVEAVAGADDGLAYLVAEVLPDLSSDMKIEKGQLVLVGVEAAKVVRQSLGEHWDDPVDEVEAVGALKRFAVELRADGDVVRDVGDVDAQPPALRGLVERDRVVKVFGVRAVDGDDEVLPQVESVTQFLFGYGFRIASDSFRTFCGNSVRNSYFETTES
jgi:hypothetical protein